MTPDTPVGPDSLSAPGRPALENHFGGADAATYRTYQLELIAPRLGASVLEVGAGLGELAARRLARRAHPRSGQSLLYVTRMH